ncbi:MAG: tRNA pseudouridine(55) synthase TruB [candidate division WOR-3 bacterium]|nr:tRNA pseudouridine(55) synthase TruB [candidate division WOR-3 bacterium]MCX7757818.1 tRNA pseudouridine(55) synthase TruB [candidate division WOR-3 bacterium]MDW7987095.1 tRNA pseudouridine(55) synthase TruB [candidate division WOR-3 bacterium]
MLLDVSKTLTVPMESKTTDAVKLTSLNNSSFKLRGVLPVIKPQGITSYDCIRKLKRIFKNAKLGHAGTLDPNASGLLLILFNDATKLSPYLSSQDKEYEATLRLGITTDTDDITGNVLKIQPVPSITEDNFKELLKTFLGIQTQIPPKFSAIKLQGKKSYELARKGINFELPARIVSVKYLELVDFTLPLVRIKALVSKGTYIRALVRDIGEKLGCGACLETLVRSKISHFTIEKALPIDEVTYENVLANLIPPYDALPELPTLTLISRELKNLTSGLTITKNLPYAQETLLRIIDEAKKNFVIGKYQNGIIRPLRVIYADL